MTVLMDTLNPAIVDIAPEGLSLSCEATGPELGLDEPEEKFEGPLTIQLELVQHDGPITVTGTFRLILHQTNSGEWVEFRIEE